MLSLACLIGVTCAAPPAAFRFGQALGDNMVLQAAPEQAMVWGFSPAGASVSVNFNGKKITATTGAFRDAPNTWKALLPATKASFDPLTISASYGDETINITNVTFGDVWICSGQSNMQMPIGSATCWNASNINCTDHTKGHNTAQCGYGCVENAGDEIAAMAKYNHNIRLFVVGGNSQKAETVTMSSATGWLTPEQMGGKFSATCWFFGRDLSTKITDRPLGFIETNVGGTPDQHWSSQTAIDQCKGSDPWDWPANFSDSVLWNGMVVPLLRTTIKGAIWYQGEANSRADGRQYACSFPAMISDWRAQFNKETDGATSATFPFGWAQLNSNGQDIGSNYPAGGAPLGDPTKDGEFGQWHSGFPSIRLAQTRTLSLQNTFQAVILDTPVRSGSVHSPFKQPVGSRLARGGLAVAYGMVEFTKNGNPTVASVAVVAAGSGGDVDVVVKVAGADAILATVGANGFEVLEEASKLWKSVPIKSFTASSVTIGPVKATASAVRYLWYSSPCGLDRFLCPVTTKVDALGSLSGEKEFVPLGPFVMKL